MVQRSYGKRTLLEYRSGEVGAEDGGKGMVEEILGYSGWSHVGEDWSSKENIFPVKLSYFLFFTLYLKKHF